MGLKKLKWDQDVKLPASLTNENESEISKVQISND